MESKKLHPTICHDALEKLTMLLQEGTGANKVRALIDEFPDCETAILDQVATWDKLKMAEVPEPSPLMEESFYRALNKIDLKESSPSLSEPAPSEAGRKFIARDRLLRLAVAASIFMGGLVIGKYFIGSSTPSQFASLDLEKPPQEYLTYVITQRSDKISATDKIEALHQIRASEKPDSKVLDALFQALQNDPNTNVRLSAVETLVYFADRPEVREFLIKAIPYQDSPLVQIALAEATLVLQQKGAAEAWQELLSSDDVEPDVRMHLQKTLKNIL